MRERIIPTRNGVHASSTVKAARDEIQNWFTDAEKPHWIPTWKPWIVEGDPKKGPTYCEK